MGPFHALPTVRVHVLFTDIPFDEDERMETRRLELLVDLTRLGSMRAVAAERHTSTSAVSQQLSVLAREVGATLVEPDGRRVRLTPAGRRLAEHAVTILAAVDAARGDLDPGAEPSGTVRVAGFATAVRRSLMPVVARLGGDHPGLRLLVSEHEPAEAFQLLATDDVDLALVYDYQLVPAAFGPGLQVRPLWSAAWALGVPDGSPPPRAGARSAEVVGGFGAADWVVNSRHTADEDVVRTLAATAGFVPRVAHRADSLDLVQDLVAAGLGVGLLPADQPVRAGVRLLPLADPDVRLRCHAAVRRGRAAWPPLALVLRLLGERTSG